MIIHSYIDPTDEYYRFIRTFNKDPNSFDVDSCLETYKRIKLHDDEGDEETNKA